MKKYMTVLAAAFFAMMIMPHESEANPRFGKKKYQKENAFKHENHKQMHHARNMQEYHYQQDKIQALRSMAKADGRITRSERAIIKYEERKAFGNQVSKKHRKGNFSRR